MHAACPASTCDILKALKVYPQDVAIIDDAGDLLAQGVVVSQGLGIDTAHHLLSPSVDLRLVVARRWRPLTRHTDRVRARRSVLPG